MSGVSWDSFVEAPEGSFDHAGVQAKLMGAMETGHRGVAREILDEYAKEYPNEAEILRLSLVRRYGTGL